MSKETGRDDFIISIRSAFLNKGTRQKFSLFTLLILSLFILSLEYFKSGPVDKFRSITKDLIFQGSYLVSSPFNLIKDKYNTFIEHMNMYEEYKLLQSKELKIENIEIENKFLLAENELLKKLIEDQKLFFEDSVFSKVLLDQQSPYLKSIIVNKGLNHNIKRGAAVKESSYYVGKIVNVNYLTSRVLLASDLNSKIPVIVEPGSINAILSGIGNNKFAVLDYLPKSAKLEDGHLVYTSGVDGNIKEGIPIGTVFIKENKKFVNFFVNYSQLKFVKVYR